MWVIPFYANVLFLYPLGTSENKCGLTFSGGLEIGHWHEKGNLFIPSINIATSFDVVERIPMKMTLKLFHKVVWNFSYTHNDDNIL